MFSKAKVKRFNEEVPAVPAPNAYDAKYLASNAGGTIKSTSQRWQDPKYVTPGPGEYLVPSGLAVSKPGQVVPGSAHKLARTSSFRLKKGSKTDLGRGSSSSDVFITPSTSSTPRKLQRSVSSSDLLSPTKQQEEIEKYKAQIKELEERITQLAATELNNEDDKLNENTDNDKKDKLEALDAELSSCKSELKYQRELVEQLLDEKDQLIKRCDCLREKEDRIDSLKGEVELLNEDNFNLETEVKILKDEREKEEDAKNGFLYFTQEQLNLQIESLQHVVNSLRQENHLVSRGLNKMVRALQQEKQNAQAEKEKLREVTEHYTRENADSEQEFKQLKMEIVQLRETVAVLSDENETLKENLTEAQQELEVQENDKSVLKQAMKELETEKNGLAMDLGILVKNKEEASGKLEETTQKNQELERELEDVRSEIHELEMSKLGLEGTLASIREELGQAEASLQGREDKIEEKEENIKRLRDRESKLEELLQDNAMLISKIDELTGLVKDGCEDNARMIQKASQLRNDLTEMAQLLSYHQQQEINAKELLVEQESMLEKKDLRIKELNEDLSANHEKIDSLEIQIKSTLETMAKETESKLKIEEILSNKENEVTDLSNKITELKLSREEIEESLLDTQELVECMEKKLQDAYNEYKKETDRLTADMECVNANMDDVKLERTKLIDINTDLSNQVSESLHAIANLQERERSLESRCKEYELQLEIEGEELDNNRTLISQLEQDVAGLQAELETCLSEIGAMEVERIQLKETLNVVLEQLEDGKDQLRQTNSELKQSKTVGRELLVRVQELETQATNWESEVNKWKQRTCDRETEVSMVQHDLQLMQDKVHHLEQVGHNLERSLIEKGDKVEEQKHEVSKLKVDLEKAVADKNNEVAKQEEVTKANHRLKGNLEQHQDELRNIRQKMSDVTQQLETSFVRCKILETQMEAKTEEAASLASDVSRLNTSIKVKSDVIESKNAMLKEREERIKILEEDLKEKEVMRMKEMDLLINLRTDLENKEAEIADLKENTTGVEELIKSAQSNKDDLDKANNKIDDLENAIEQWKAKLTEADSVMKLMESKLEEEEERNRALEQMIEPFKDQLESFELEKNSLLSENAQAYDEVKKLATQYGQLLGHQNQKQKIQHVVKIKQENVELKTEITNLRKQVAKQKQNITKLEDKLNEAMGVKRFDPRLSFATPSKNKENMTPSKMAKDTPMGPPKLGFRGRSNSSVTLGSPLRDKNY